MVAELATPKIFTPLKVGNVTLQHRVVMAPLTRFRADDNHVHQTMAEEYYAQRATLGGLQITEATFISEEAAGYNNVPGIWSEPQIAAWKRIVDRVHAKGGFIYLQLWALGRTASPDVLAKDGHKLVSAGNIPMKDGGVPPTPLTREGIRRYVATYAQAAKNAVFGAGFDGVEVHNANGYLLDQFLQTNSNNRTDEYGGSVENRSRFTLQVVEAVAEAVTPERTGIRLSPHSDFQGMRMAHQELKAQFTYVVSNLAKRHPNLAYIHLTEPRISGSTDVAETQESIDFLREAWAEREGSAFLTAGGYSNDPRSAFDNVEKYGGAVAFGRAFIPNPDLMLRLRYAVELEPYDRSTFYKANSPEGYSDYAYSPQLVGKH